MPSVLIVGGIGTGKTLLMTLMALDDTRDVYANYLIRIPNYKKLTPSKLERMKGAALLLIDEGYIWMESRSSSSLSNRFWTYVIFQSRKRSLDLVTTCQMYSSLDVRFRTMADYVIEAERVDDGFRYTVYQGGRDLVNARGVQSIASFGIDRKLAEELFPYYDTMELVSPIDSYLTAEVESDPQELNELVDQILTEIQKVWPIKDIKRFHVDDFCTKNGYPVKYGKYVWNRIQTMNGA